MSLKLPKRLSSRKKKLPKDTSQAEVLKKLGLDAFWTTPLDQASMLDISTWTLDNQAPQEPKDLPKAFLKRLWLLSPDARCPSCKPLHDVLNNTNKSPEEMIDGVGGEAQCVVNPLDLVTAVFMSANTFLQEEMTVRMFQSQFAVPLILPNIDPQEPSQFLLWPLRGVVSQWRSHLPDNNREVHIGSLASTCMPMVSCVKLGHSGVSKSQVLNNVISGLRSTDTFIHREMDGGQLPRRLSNGLVEIGWYLPTGDIARDSFPCPVVFSNLRGEASAHGKHLRFLCQASSAVVVFCGNLREKEKEHLVSYKNMTRKLILIDLSDCENNKNRVVGFVGQNLEEYLMLPRGSVLQAGGLSVEKLANRLSDRLKAMLPGEMKPVTLEEALPLAEEQGIHVDEGTACKKAKATAEEVLKGLDEGSAQFREEQLPLQGHIWGKLGEIEKEERKQGKKEKGNNAQLQKDKKDIRAALNSYKMTPAMKIFTNALFAANKVERAYFLGWMKLMLRLKQIEKQNGPYLFKYQLTEEKKDDTPEYYDKVQNGANGYLGDADSFYTDSTFEEENTKEPPLQVSEQLWEMGQELKNGLQSSTEKTVEPQSKHVEHIESTHDPDIEQKEIQGEEQISNLVLEDENHDLGFGENQTLSWQWRQRDDPELTLLDGSEPEMTQSDETEQKPDMTLAQSNLTSSDEQQMDLHVSFEPLVASCSQPLEADPSLLGLEHFFREMGLIFELKHSSGFSVPRFPGLAADLLLYGIPIELMDGDASNIPIRWLGCVFAELRRRLPQEKCRTRVLTNLGVHHGRNAEVLSALFGIKFPDRRERSTRGMYMAMICLPSNLRKDMQCDFLLLIDVQGLCSVSLDNNRNVLIHDNEMATVAAGLSDILMQNISHVGTEFETKFTVIANALLRIKECGSMPICQILVQDDAIKSLLQTSQLKRISDILQSETADRRMRNADNHCDILTTPSCVTGLKGPWCNMTISEPVDAQYTEAVLKLKQHLFGALKKCAATFAATGLPEFMQRLCAVWDAVKAETFTIGLQNTDIALAFSLLCVEFSQQEKTVLEHIENWINGATMKIAETKALDTVVPTSLLRKLKDEAREEVRIEVDKLRSLLEAYWMRDNLLKKKTFKPILISYVDDLQKRVTEEAIQRLETGNDSHFSSTQLEKFETLLEKEQESKLHALVENSKSTKVLLQDAQLEEEFEGMWRKTLSSLDFRPSETDNDDITARVTDVLKNNLISRGLQKHMRKIEVIFQNQTLIFHIHDEYFGYRSRVKHMKDNNRLQRLEAQQLACNIIKDYKQFVEDVSSLPAVFSDSYITKMLENVEKALRENSMEIRSAFEVDLKVFLCRAACQDFQKLHDHYIKDSKLLTCINASKTLNLTEFIYQFRKRDQCQRMAQAFISMVIKPTVLDYIYSPLGGRIVEEIKGKAQEYHSPGAFHQSLLEELIKKDRFESFLEYLLSYEKFRKRKIQETVVAHLSESPRFDKWRQQRLGEIVGKIAAAVSQTAEGTNGVLSDTKPLLERVCLILESDGNVDVNRTSLDGPLFSITTEWDRFVTCLMEFLATMRLDLAQEFSQNMEVTHFLQSLPIQPKDSLFNTVRGCIHQCPLCKAPCELEEMGHEIHRALLHRPKAMLPHDSGSLSCCPESMTEGNPGMNDDTSEACRALDSLYPDWSFSPEEPNSQMPNSYWRYVLARFNESFAMEYEQEPANIPEEWRKITKEEAVHSLKNAFLSSQC